MEKEMSKYEKEYFEIRTKMAEYINYLVKENDLKEGLSYRIEIDFMPFEGAIEWNGESLLEVME